MKGNYKKIQSVSEEEADKLVDAFIYCNFCNEPFRECVTVIPGVGVIIGETDVKKYKNKFWHYGCIADFEKKQSSFFKNYC